MQKLADWIVMLLLRKLGGNYFPYPCFWAAWIVLVSWDSSKILVTLIKFLYSLGLHLFLHWYVCLIINYILAGVGGCGRVLYPNRHILPWEDFICMGEWELERLCWWTCFMINCKDHTWINLWSALISCVSLGLKCRLAVNIKCCVLLQCF